MQGPTRGTIALVLVFAAGSMLALGAPPSGQPDQRQVMLRYAQFDPANGLPALPADLADDSDGPGAFIIQLGSIARSEQIEDLAALGASDATFLPYASFIARLDAGALKAVAALPYVRSITRFQPAFRLDEQLLRERFGWDPVKPGAYDGPALDKSAASPVQIMVLRRGPEQRRAVADAVIAMGGAVDELADDQGFTLRATLDRAQLRAVAFMPEVLFIDPWGPPGEDMDEQRVMGGANYIEGLLGFSGQGVRGEVMDGGIRATHVAYTPPPTIHAAGAVGSATHGTSCYGIIFGNGALNAPARGLIPNATGYFASYSSYAGGSRMVHTSQLVQAPYECVFQSNSWGGTLTTSYTTTSASMDDILFLYDIIICQSQSNAGTQSSRPEAWAKNIVSVGGIATRNTADFGDDAWTSASIGPASDGRLKPDLSNSYDNVLTTTTTASAPDTAYTSTFNGTSSATPIVAGHFGLFFQMWNARVFGNTVNPAGTVFSNRPRAATAKAMLINTARQYTFSGTTVNLARYKQGWGFPDLKKLFDLRNRMLISQSPQSLTVGQTWTTHVNVVADGTPLRITMVYRDPKGTVPSTVHRINDLTLKVTAPDSTVYWGNNGLAAGNWSTPGGVANDRDTVENVFIQAPMAGDWTIEVIASEVNQDADTSTPDIDASFSLVASGLAPPPVAPGCSPADVASEGTNDITAGPDGFVTGIDFDVFIEAYFTGFRRMSDNALLADITNGTGSGGPDGFLTGTDFDKFVELFFAGC